MAKAPAGGDPAKEKTKPGEITRTSDALVDRYGYIHRTLYSPDADTLAKLKQEAEQWLAAISQPRKNVSVSHPGIPKLKRGDAMRLALPDMRLQDLWITEAHYTIQPGAFDMELVLAKEDPFVETIVDKLTETATERDRVPPVKKVKKGPKPKNYSTRKNKPVDSSADDSGSKGPDAQPGAYGDQ
jgi:hypothetical protein